MQAVVARGRDTKETKTFQDVRLAGEQESLPQQAEVTIGGCYPPVLPGKGTQWHRCLSCLAHLIHLIELAHLIHLNSFEAIR